VNPKVAVLTDALAHRSSEDALLAPEDRIEASLGALGAAPERGGTTPTGTAG
jgi:hypothetical protein